MSHVGTVLYRLDSFLHRLHIPHWLMGWVCWAMEKANGWGP